MRWYGHTLRMNKENIHKKVSGMKIKGKHSLGRLRSWWEQRVRKDVTQRKERPQEETKELWEDEQLKKDWLSDDPLKVEKSWKHIISAHWWISTNIYAEMKES